MKLPRLTLRDLFWLTTLVAVCLAWRIDAHQKSVVIDDFVQHGYRY